MCRAIDQLTPGAPKDICAPVIESLFHRLDTDAIMFFTPESQALVRGSLCTYGVANCAINVSNLRHQKHILDPFEMHILYSINVSIVIASIHILKDLQNKKS